MAQASKAIELFPRNKISTAIRAGLSLLVAGTFSQSLFAEEADDADDQTTEDAQAVSDDDNFDNENYLEEVIVTGFAGSLRTSQALKENSPVVVDSLTAEDMGALADRSVTEALQRVPGVAINRFAAGRDPDHFSVEGSNLIVRGLTYVKSEVNGRDAFTANNGRGLNFADISPELLAGVDVFKTLTADRIEGGIAGTINLRTRKPFDTEGPQLLFSAEGTYSDFIEKWSPTVSILGSYRWDTDHGEFGILGSFVYSQVQSRADRFQISNFAERTLYSNGDVIESEGATPVKQVYFPRGAVMGTQEFDRERYGMSAALQWRSNDESMEATAEFLRSDAREAWTEHTMEIATDVVTDQGDSRAVPGTTFTFDNSDIFDSGYITGPAGWRDDQWSGDPRTPAQGLQSNNILRDVTQKYVTDDLSINFKWFIGDDWALNFDYQHVKSTVDNTDAGLWTSSYQDLAIDLNGTKLPDVRFTPIQPCEGGPNNECSSYYTGEHQSYTDPFNSFYRSAMDHIEESEGTSDAFRIDASKIFDNSDWLDSIQFGYRYADRDQTARFSTYNWGNLSEIWGNGGPVWLDDPITANGGQPLDGYKEFYFDEFFKNKTNNPIGNDGRLFYDGLPSQDYDAYREYANAITADWPNGQNWRALADRVGAVPGTPFLVNEINPVREKNNAAYVTLSWDHAMDNGMGFKGNIGLRYTDTNRTASGFEVFEYQEFTSEEECNEPLPPGQNKSAWCSLDKSVRDDARAYSDGTRTQTDFDLDYNYWLPSVNLLLTVKEGLQFRGSYFKGVAPPDFGLTRAFFPINLQTDDNSIAAGGGRPIGRFNAGNPDLLPVESHNFDLTAEWYFADVGQLTFALFYKELKNIRTNDVTRRTFTNNGATFDAIVTTAVNSKETGKIKGFEVAYQQVYNFGDGWLSGFGLNANYTYVDSNNVPQSTLSETDPDVAAGEQSTVDISLLPLEGLSKHTVNLQPFYEYGKWSARLAYSWRSEFLLTIRDVIVPYQPVMNESTGQLDASLFYQITDNLSIGFQGTNLTEEVIRTTAVLNDDLLEAPRSWFLSDTRYSLVLRGRF